MKHQSDTQVYNFLINEIREILSEQDHWDGYVSEESFSGLFTPFANVLKVAKVAVKDVLTSTLNVAKQVLTFDLDKKKEIEDKYRQAKSEISQEYSDVMAPIDATLNSTDARLLSFAMNPGMFVATSIAKGAAAAGMPIIDYAAEKIDLPEFRKDGDTNKERTAAKAGSTGPLLGLMSDLNKIFFSPLSTTKDMLLASDNVISEQDASATGEVDEKALEVAKVVLKDMGVWDKLQALSAKRVSEKIAETKELEEEYSEVMDLINQFRGSTSLASAKSISTKLGERGLDLSEQIKTVESAINKQIQKIQADKSGNIKQELLNLGSELTSGLTVDSTADKFVPIVEQTIISMSLKDALSNVKEDMFKQIMGFVSEGMSESELRKLTADSPENAQFSNSILGLAKRLASK